MAKPTNGADATHDFKAARRRRATLTDPTKIDRLPPHSVEAEQGVLGCIMLSPLASLEDCWKKIPDPEAFYDLRHRMIYEAFLKRASKAKGLDLITMQQYLKDQKLLDQVGGLAYLASLPDAVPSAANLDYYIEILREKFALRKMVATCTEIVGRAYDWTGEVDDLMDTVTRDLESIATKTGQQQPMLEIIDFAEAAKFVPDPADFLVGEGLISRGQFHCIGGVPGAGKSRLGTTLAVALARGNGSWLSYPVRSQGRTLIVQTENKGIRLKDESEAVPAKLRDKIRITRALSHGIAFTNPEFRREMTRFFDKWPFELLVLDPWNDVSAEEGQSDYDEALRAIEQCFWGRKMPAVMIVAHLRKTGRDNNGKRKTGRDLLNELSGSLKLGSKSRTVFAVQPVSNQMDETRVVVELAKANDVHPDWLKEYGTRAAWVRANGAFERHDGFDWEAWDSGDGGSNEAKRALTYDMLAVVFADAKRPGMKRSELAKALAERYDIGESTAYRVCSPTGYAGAWLNEVAGVVAMKKGAK